MKNITINPPSPKPLNMLYPGPPLQHDDSIRIMHLHPGQADDAIHFNLETISVPAGQLPGGYEAISYTWGDAILQHEVFHRDTGSGHLSTMKITKNSYNALKSLRYTDSVRQLWMDSICIDQANLDERNAQVKIMKSIYAGAKGVVVYVGEPEHGSDLVMEWLAKNEHAEGRPHGSGEICGAGQTTHEAKPPSIFVSGGLEYLIQRPWFARTWVLQEVANARAVRIQCGHDTVSWRAFTKFYRTWHEDIPVLTILSDTRRSISGWHLSFAADLLHYLKATRGCSL